MAPKQGRPSHRVQLAAARLRDRCYIAWSRASAGKPEGKTRQDTSAPRCAARASRRGRDGRLRLGLRLTTWCRWLRVHLGDLRLSDCLRRGSLRHCLLSALKLDGKWPYVGLGFLAGAALVGCWFGLAFRFGSADLWGWAVWLGFVFAGGLFGGATGLTFWSLAFRKPLLGRAAP